MALNPLVSLFGCLVARSGRKCGNRETDGRTDGRTDLQTKYCNLRCAHVASGAGQSAVVTLLLDHRADVHAVTEVGDCSSYCFWCMHITFVAIFNFRAYYSKMNFGT